MHDDRGLYTTEFWITAIIGALTAFVNSGLFPGTSWQVKVAAIVIAGFTAANYIKGRSELKSSIAGGQQQASNVTVNAPENQTVNPVQPATKTTIP